MGYVVAGLATAGAITAFMTLDGDPEPAEAAAESVEPEPDGDVQQQLDRMAAMPQIAPVNTQGFARTVGDEEAPRVVVYFALEAEDLRDAIDTHLN